MAVRSYVNQQVQVGVESIHGTPVACNKLLEAFAWTFGPKPVTKQFTATGRKQPGASELLYESGAGKISGQGCYQTLVYVLSNLYGTPTPTLHSPSTTAYDWLIKPGLTGPYSPTTLTAQYGDSIDAEQWAYLLFTGWGYTFTRKQEVQISGDFITQSFTDGVSLTASPTGIAQLPMVGAHGNMYLDSTSAGIGGTLVTNDVLKADFKDSGVYGPYYPINRANPSFTSHLDTMPKRELKVTFHASSAAVAYKATYLNTGAKAYIRNDFQGPLIDSPNNIHAEFKHDVVAYMTDFADFTNIDEALGYEATFVICEDLAWNSGQSQALTFTNLLASL